MKRDTEILARKHIDACPVTVAISVADSYMFLKNQTIFHLYFQVNDQIPSVQTTGSQKKALDYFSSLHYVTLRTDTLDNSVSAPLN